MADPYDSRSGVFAISVAADMVVTGVQNLRVYEKAGLVDPQRTPGGTRLYSLEDIERLRQIAAAAGRRSQPRRDRDGVATRG